MKGIFPIYTLLVSISEATIEFARMHLIVSVIFFLSRFLPLSLSLFLSVCLSVSFLSIDMRLCSVSI